jgi:type IV pilus assembly protein PilQ
MNNQNGIKGVRMMQQLVVAMAMVLASIAAHAQMTIDAVAGSTSGGAEVVRIELSQPLAAAPAGFSIQSPARIALDFPGISNGMGRSTIDINQGNLKSVSVVQAGDRTRVVLNLKQATTYKTLIQGKSLLVTLDPSASSVPVPICICGKQKSGYAAAQRCGFPPWS